MITCSHTYVVGAMFRSLFRIQARSERASESPAREEVVSASADWRTCSHDHLQPESARAQMLATFTKRV